MSGIFGPNVLGAADVRETPLPCDYDTLAAFGISQGYDIYYFDADPFIAGPPKPEFSANQYAHAFSSKLCSFVKWDGKLWVRDEVMNQVLAEWPKPAVIPPAPKPIESPVATGPLPPAPEPIDQPGDTTKPGTAKAGLAMVFLVAGGVIGLGWLLMRKKKR
jgi:hypothetical protein